MLKSNINMKKLFTLFFALVASVGTLFAWDYERVQIGDMYYNLDATNQTAEVTSPDKYPSFDGYGNYHELISADIPSSIIYNEDVYTVTGIGDKAFLYSYSLTSVTIPSTITRIGHYAFVCSHISTISIPSSVSIIEENAFGADYHAGQEWANSNLIAINVDSDNSNYSSTDGVLYDKLGTTLIQCPQGKTGAFSIPTNVIRIGKSAFACCHQITSVEVPASVITIEAWAFQTQTEHSLDTQCQLSTINVADNNTTYASVDGVLDTYIGGDNDDDKYYFDYDSEGEIVVYSIERTPIKYNKLKF